MSVREEDTFEVVPKGKDHDAHEQNQADRTDHLLALINLELWCRLYLDGATTAGLTDELRASLAA